MKIELTKENVKLLGRTYHAGDRLILGLSGTGLEFLYKGSGFDITLTAGKASLVPDNEENYARIAVYLNNRRITDIQLKQKETILHIPASDSAEDPAGVYDGYSLIRLIKLSEVAMSVVAVHPFNIKEDEVVVSSGALPHRIEFIGDSITCGYGVDDHDPLHLFKTATEDVTKAFAYKTAHELDAEYSLFSASGYGIISGYTDDPSVKVTEELIPTYYESMGLSYDSIDSVPDTRDTPWDFDLFKPEAVVINLGTNDDSYCQDDAEKQNEFAKLYTDFLKTVRKHNADAVIFCVLGLMGDRLYPFIQKAVSDHTARTGDENIVCVHLPEQDGNVGYAADYHPLESAHDKAVTVLTAAIRKVMGW